MVNRLISVNENNELPSAVQEALVVPVRSEFQALTTTATSAAATATTSATTATNAATAAAASAVNAAAAATLGDRAGQGYQNAAYLFSQMAYGADYATSPLLAGLKAGVANRSQSTRVVGLGDSNMNGGNSSKPSMQWFYRLAGRAGCKALPADVSVASTAGTGMIWYKGAAGGLTSANYATSATTTKVINLIQPATVSYVLHMVGTNDLTANTTPATYKANVGGAANTIETGAISSITVFILPHLRIDTIDYRATWNAYKQVLKELVAEKPTRRLFIDMDEYFKSYNMTGENGFSLFASDNLHLNDSGNKVLADIVGTVLGIPSESIVGPSNIKMVLPGEAAYTTVTVMGQVDIPAANFPRWVRFCGVMAGWGTGSGTAEASYGLYIPGTDTKIEGISILLPDAMGSVPVNGSFFLPSYTATAARFYAIVAGGTVTFSGNAAYDNVMIEVTPA